MTDLVTAFRAAEQADRVERIEGEEHSAFAARIHAAHQAKERAALALIADAVGRHKIEERSVVYLVLGPNGWEIDGPTTDGSGLYGHDDGPIAGEACEHSSGLHPDSDELNTECRALADAAAYVPLPNARQLTAKLIAAGQGPVSPCPQGLCDYAGCKHVDAV
jgi:hypothetical protein